MNTYKLNFLNTKLELRLNTESTLDTANEQKLILQLLNIFLLNIIILVPKVHYYKIGPT